MCARHPRALSSRSSRRREHWIRALNFIRSVLQLAQSTLTWDGERQSKRAWHDLLLHSWMLATGKEPRLVEGLNGGRVSLLMGTRDMGISEMSELIDFATAWAVEHGIEVE